MTALMLDIRHRNEATKKRLARVYEKFAAQLANLAYTGPDKLYREMQDRLEDVGQLLRLEKLPLAFETLYGIGLGIDGLQSHWGAMGSPFAASDDDD